MLLEDSIFPCICNYLIKRIWHFQVQRPVDPFEYLRNMPAGASMEPIIDPHSKSSTRQSVSYPVYLMKVMPGSHKYVPGKFDLISGNGILSL